MVLNNTENVIHIKHPYDVWIVDNFLDATVLDSVLKAWPKANSDLWHSGYKKLNESNNILEQKMLSISKRSGLSNYINDFLDFVHSKKMTIVIGNITSENRLISDVTERWSGLRMMLEGSHQLIHSDARRHPENGLRKEITCLLYLGPDPVIDGNLEIWGDDMQSCLHEIEPKTNRLVIFKNSDTSYHGVPKVSSLRKSITWSIMSTSESSTRGKALFVKRPQDPSEVGDLGILRSKIGDNNEN
tara:strand:+ start:300 stop:1031 length:732 start_codon:yes stop_codon:yes gene_type:complete